MAQITLVEAINLALKREMGNDPAVVVLGEDVGVDGGVFRATLGLTERFGAERVIDTPLAEGLIAGMSIGMAVEGLKPVAEIQFSGFGYTTIDQILNNDSHTAPFSVAPCHRPKQCLCPSRDTPKATMMHCPPRCIPSKNTAPISRFDSFRSSNCSNSRRLAAIH